MDYSASIQSAINFMEENLFEDIAPADVADRVGFSEYHFHRIFHGMLAESVAAYIRKRRIFETARLLRTTDKSIYELANLARFDSRDSYTRAFKKIYKVGPGEFRRLKSKGWDFQKEPATKKMLQHLKGGITLEPRLEMKDAQHVVGLAASYPDDRPREVENQWKLLQERKEEISAINPGVAIGVFLADHPSVVRRSRDTYVYLAGLPVASVVDIPEGMCSCTIPAGQYAVFTHKGPVDTVMHSINYIWGTWIPNNLENYRHVNGPDFELYGPSFDQHARTGVLEICVPVKRG
jgi:AraC family transcriptional regulator